jgi:hypothetical protein
VTQASRKSMARRIIGALGQLPSIFFHLMKGKAESLVFAAKMAESANTLILSPDTIRRIELSLKQQLKSPAHLAAELSMRDKELLTQIRNKTHKDNRNNVTRTQAYWELYKTHPELHWALLAHMVSRNGGWSMTDLKGDLLPRLLTGVQLEQLFGFLERANGLIFQDAYPQLLLYQESKRRNQSLMHLLPHLQISAFMQPVWQQFWEQRDSTLLTICLIVNEQNYIERRIIQNPKYRHSVLDTFIFKTQSMLQLNQVMFPYGSNIGSNVASNNDSKNLFSLQSKAPISRLAGLILEDFGDLSERIEFGKKLYAILFGLPAVHEGVITFARTTTHTGSRSDYWPQLFAPIKKAPPEAAFKERLNGCQLMKDAAPFYSPTLAQAWKDRELEAVESGDWFVNLKAIQHIRPIPVPFLFDMSGEACFGLNKIELAVVAGQVMKG